MAARDFKRVQAPRDLIYDYIDDYARDNHNIIQENNLGDTLIDGTWSDVGDGLDYNWYGPNISGYLGNGVNIEKFGRTPEVKNIWTPEENHIKDVYWDDWRNNFPGNGRHDYVEAFYNHYEPAAPMRTVPTSSVIQNTLNGYCLALSDYGYPYYEPCADAPNQLWFNINGNINNAVKEDVCLSPSQQIGADLAVSDCNDKNQWRVANGQIQSAYPPFLCIDNNLQMNKCSPGNWYFDFISDTKK